MYCVKCGVRLQEGVESCPLCQTPVWNPDALQAKHAWPDQLPEQHNERDLSGAVGFTVLSVVAAAAILVVNFVLYGYLDWGGYVLGGIGLFYLMAVLPRWFRHPRGEVFIPLSHVAVGLFLLYVNEKTGGNWFLSFAFPLVGISCLLSTGLFCLLKYVKGAKPYILGGYLVAVGGFSMLTEFFEHITFGSRMFHWSIYTAGCFGAAGLFLLTAGFIPRLRAALRKYFFF